MTDLRRIRQNWHLYGLARCTSYLPRCNRLMWPWQDIGGNGETPMHRPCARRNVERLQSIVDGIEESA